MLSERRGGRQDGVKVAQQLEGQEAGKDDTNKEYHVVQEVSELADGGDGDLLCLGLAADHRKRETDFEDQQQNSQDQDWRDLQKLPVILISVPILKIMSQNTIVKVREGGGQGSMVKDHTFALFNFGTLP